ncbi:MAG: virulence RhuM family protein, partial [Selenomonas sp.]|nr:virulence RhuM family protein [Selenomonas sp.]
MYEDEELNENSTCAKFAQVADNGKTYQYKFYALSAIIAVGYKVNS